MKKAVCCLLVLVSLQFLWAAAALACQHEIDPTAVHLGHHTPSNSSSDQSDGSSGSALGGDCAICHLTSVKLGGMADLLFPESRATAQIEAEVPRFSSHIPIGPERPNWNSPVSSAGQSSSA